MHRYSQEVKSFNFYRLRNKKNADNLNNSLRWKHYQGNILCKLEMIDGPLTPLNGC